MLIRVSGASSGVADYLENGRKVGRDFARDELDERVILDGDLARTEAIINAMEKEGDRYLHITLAFKEDQLDPETLRAITAEFKDFAMTAYAADEYNFYAEAHLPRIKSYADGQSGAIVERKPHIHVVIPQQNLLSGQNLNPFGKVDQQTQFLEAFQEHTNAKHGLASPKDNRRIEFTDESTVISRHRGDLFEGAHSQLKARLLERMLDQRIDNFEQFTALVAQEGTPRMRNASTARAYLNVKPEGAAKGINLKEHVFSRAFVELSTDQKYAALAVEVKRNYEMPSTPKATDHQRIKKLQEWREFRAHELKHINSGNRNFYAKYRAAAPDAKRVMLEHQRDRFNANHREAIPHDRAVRDPHRTSRSQDDLERVRAGHDGLHRQRSLSSAPTLAQTPTLDSLPRLSGRALARDPDHAQQLLPTDARHNVEREGAARADALRRPDSRSDGTRGVREKGAVDQYAADRAVQVHIEIASKSVEIAEIKQSIDAERLLAHLSQTHGVMPEKYVVVKGADGADRIKCGTRNLNTSDFLTKEMNLPWRDAEPLLRQVYEEQRNREPGRAVKLAPRREMWQDFRAEWPAKEAAHKSIAWNAQRASERERRTAIRDIFSEAKTKIELDRRATGAENKAAKSIARMRRVQDEMQLRDATTVERNTLRAKLKRPQSEQYRDYLVDRAHTGDSGAVDELRRQNVDRIQGGSYGASVTATTAPKDQATFTLKFDNMAYSVARNGDVTYIDRQTGQALLRDTNREVQILQIEDKTIETALRIGAAKWGSELQLNGSPAFKKRAVEIADASELRITFDDPTLNKYAAQLRIERERKADEKAEITKVGRDAFKQAEKTIPRVASKEVPDPPKNDRER